MFYKFEFRAYRRKFATPLNTFHGIWENRDGVILRLTDKTGKVGWGEIAPISWFGSETVEQAVSFCRKLPLVITDKTIFSIPDELPTCQFGFESAREMIQQNNSAAKIPQNLTHSILLPAGKAALSQWRNVWDIGSHTFKWKIGVYPFKEELFIFDLLVGELPTSTKLRLDANGGLSYGEAEIWLQKCDDININNDIDLEIKANHRSDFIKQNIMKINGYSRYSMYSPNRSFIRKNKDSRSFTKYLINDLLKPRYNNFEKKSHKEATKLIEKKYEFQDPERFEVNKYQGIFF